MYEVTVVIPNYNGIEFLDTCIKALKEQTYKKFAVVLVDNGSKDDSISFVSQHLPEAEIVALDKNYGFCRAVNEGIKRCRTPFVILLNNDTKVFPDFVKELLDGMKRNPNAFSGNAKMLQFHKPDLIDDAGDLYSAFGWAFARGKGKNKEEFETEDYIFAACGGASIYRMEYLEKTGLFDETHFAYLEDIDLGYRARISGYDNMYFPKAKVYHVGSGTSGSTYNAFKTRYGARNNIYMIKKNMPVRQQIINSPFLAFGFGLKLLFFMKKGLGREYFAGLREGSKLVKLPENRDKVVAYKKEHAGNYKRIQKELFKNLFRRV